VFWFKSQNIDNFLRTFLMSIPMWTMIQCFTLWAFANGWGIWLSPEDHWLWLAVLVLLAPAIHEVHFFCGHWLIHQGPLYKYIHSVHHNSINPSPWSSMSMHPVESAFFFSALPQSVWRRGSILALNSSGPARPYMARLKVFRRLI